MEILGIIVALLAAAALVTLAVMRPEGVPSAATTGLVVALGLGIVTTFFHQIFFYAEPGYVYHVRTITGAEMMVQGTGFMIRSGGGGVPQLTEPSALVGIVQPWLQSCDIVTVYSCRTGTQNVSASSQA